MRSLPVFLLMMVSLASLFTLGCGGGNGSLQQSAIAAEPQSNDQESSSESAQAAPGASSFEDPAPPEVHSLEAVKTPAAVSYERVTFHSAPKALSADATTHDWPSFLGPTHNGVSTETHLLKEWPEEGPTVVWEMSKGDGYASPAIAGKYLVFPHRVGDEVIIECLHPETGKSYWQHRYPTQYQDRYGYSSGPRSSPVIDGERVYILGVEGQFFCLKLATGQVVWERNINKEFGVPQDFFGTVTTPLLEGNLLIVNVGAPGGPCVVGFDKLTGKAVWGAGDKWGPSYSSPVPATIHGERRVFVFAGGDSDPPTGGLMCINPASGDVDFDFFWRSTSYESVNASCPVVVGNQVFISATYKTGSVFLNVHNNFNQDVAWQTKEVGTHWNTAVHNDGHLYCFDGRNEPDASLVCVDRKTGEVVWREIPEWEETIQVGDSEQSLSMSTLRGSLLMVDGHFLCLGEHGHLLWLDLTPDGYKQLARHRLFLAQQSWALPVLSRGLLYVTQNARDFITKKGPRLLCYDLRGK